MWTIKTLSNQSTYDESFEVLNWKTEILQFFGTEQISASIEIVSGPSQIQSKFPDFNAKQHAQFFVENVNVTPTMTFDELSTLYNSTNSVNFVAEIWVLGSVGLINTNCLF